MRGLQALADIDQRTTFVSIDEIAAFIVILAVRCLDSPQGNDLGAVSKRAQ